MLTILHRFAQRVAWCFFFFASLFNMTIDVSFARKLSSSFVIFSSITHIDSGLRTTPCLINSKVIAWSEKKISIRFDYILLFSQLNS